MENAPKVTNGWTWEPGIGSVWLTSPEGAKVFLCRPVMASPWWVIDNPDPLADHPNNTYRDGAFTPIFPRFESAMAHVVHDHNMAAPVAAPTMSFQVWHRDIATGQAHSTGIGETAQLPFTTATEMAQTLNEDQSRHDRPVDRHYFVVKATTRYEIVT